MPENLYDHYKKGILGKSFLILKQLDTWTVKPSVRGKKESNHDTIVYKKQATNIQQVYFKNLPFPLSMTKPIF